MKSLGKFIKEKRLALKLRTLDIATALNINQALISKYENDKRLPTKSQIEKLAEILQTDKDELLVLFTKAQILKYISNDEISLKALNLVQEEIKDSYKTNKVVYNSSLKAVLKKIDTLKAKVQKLRHLDSYRITEALEMEYTFESNKIEGNTLTLQETDMVINEGLTISGKSMREHLEAINHSDAINYIKDIIKKDILITEKVVLQIHNLILRGISAEYAGKYRNVQVMIKGSEYTPPQAYLVPKQMEDLFIWYDINKEILHPVVLAAEMHLRLVTIHPFIDGNGRTSRLLMNLILLKHGYVIANIKGDYDSRMAYYKSLELFQTQNKSDDFILLVANCEEADLQKYLSILQ